MPKFEYLKASESVYFCDWTSSSSRVGMESYDRLWRLTFLIYAREARWYLGSNVKQNMSDTEVHLHRFPLCPGTCSILCRMKNDFH